ncbi:carboxy terminal-processing peptidase [Undibacterium fentianense]|uniref:Carboxy terminal-processing peptidase n=1 Tax=Undibacterium fentianense TaxID=2828728 RepID=A0A941IHW8_9BURK|nr:carboxy terminal-processing peptidase [Undibacterium fentianense]MBR7801375.1 carboxy terminal-processing peptidase [Undibacterium fentianense]
MKKTLIGMAIAIAVSAHFATAESSSVVLANAADNTKVSQAVAPLNFQPLPQQIQAANMTAEFFTRFHYKAMPLDDAMSEKIFDRYVKSLDGDRIFFLQSDIDQFSAARDKLDDAILGQDLRTPFEMFNLYHKRFKERLTYARELLKTDFDFTQKEGYRYQREKEPWPQSEEQMRDLWRQRVKNDWLRLKLAGKDPAAIRTTLEKRYETTLTRMNKLKSEDVFQLFMNAYAMSVEPHTNYLGPKAAEDFDISMRLSMTGIGATLQDRDEMATVRELVPGSPAALSGKLKVGDRIVGVGQGANSTPVDVMGWRLDDVVKLIRGPKDTTVLLDVLPADAGPDGAHKTVLLVRNKITLEQQAAKKSIQEVKTAEGTRRIGVIALPTFYQDFDARRRGDKDFKSATRDVAKLLAELKKEKVDSVLIDLRDNGGGSLNEAVELTSLFIGKGPVVQQRNSQGKIHVENDSAGVIAWDGPMGVMINRGSASASEIFAAAIQDYGRGLIIGENSFGKGTVQTVISLDQMARSEKAQYGDLKMTVAQFFRVNGGTTQLRGVTPDIAYPSFTDADSYGESSYDNALPWVQIKPANYHALGNLKDIQGMLQVRHELRIAKDKEFQFIKEDVAEFKKQKEKKEISLNEEERRAERDAREKKIKDREAIRASLEGKVKTKGDASKLATQDDGLQGSERSLASELAAEKASKEAKDVLLIEAAHILSDEIELLKSSKRLADKTISRASVKSKEVE